MSEQEGYLQMMRRKQNADQYDQALDSVFSLISVLRKFGLESYIKSHTEFANKHVSYYRYIRV